MDTQEDVDFEHVVGEDEALSHLMDNGSDRLKSQIDQGIVTPIELAKAVDCRPQLIYNYIRSGKIAARKTVDTQKYVIDLSVATLFVASRLQKSYSAAQRVLQELEGH